MAAIPIRVQAVMEMSSCKPPGRAATIVRRHCATKARTVAAGLRLRHFRLSPYYRIPLLPTEIEPKFPEIWEDFDVQTNDRGRCRNRRRGRRWP